MIPLPVVTDDLVSAFLACRYKGYLKLTGETGEPSDYQRLQDRLDAEYRAAALSRPPSRPGRRRKDPRPADSSWPPKVGAELTAGGESCRPDGLEPAVGGHEPILCVRRDRVTRADRLRLGFQAAVLGRTQGADPRAGTVIHGPKFARMRIPLGPAIAGARTAAAGLAALAGAPEPPKAVLNRHCPDCEFRARCRAAAVERDDLTLLAGVPDKEVARLHKNGVFTVTQYAHTFRPGRLKKAAKLFARGHDPALQARAVRDKTIFVVRRPEVPDARVRVYLDVEGLTDPDRYYLVGLLVVEGDAARHVSLWADGPADEPALWAGLLKEVAPLGTDVAVFHYGSYDARFLRRMGERHGGDPKVVALLEEKAVNVLSLVHGRVYFPVYANGLKDVAGCLGFRWVDPEPSGRQAIVWRHQWEANPDPAVKAQLVAYNRDDCAALRQVTDALRAIAGHTGVGGPDPLPVAEAGDVRAPKRHKFGDPDYVVPEFNRIVRCAYFDYQRDKVLLRTNPAVRKAVRRLQRPAPPCPVNRDTTFQRPKACPQCGSGDLHVRGDHKKLTVDLKPVRGGLKRWVTRQQAKSYRCGGCGHEVMPWDCHPGRQQKYGWTVCGLAAYATVGLRVTTEAAADVLGDLFGVRIQRAVVTLLRGVAADRYRGTYEAILAGLRAGPVVHADETWAQIKRPSTRGYVWVFANPTAAAYVYAPTRDGDTPRQVLAGFKGVLVTDFYAGYDGMDCPQQKCLVHLARDLNDEVVKNPFDGELKELAAGFSTVMQGVVRTIDRHGLKTHFLAKHRREVDRFYARHVDVDGGSEAAAQFRKRLARWRPKLFTFLDHDGVPWNNNNAENAVKRWVTRRKAMGGTAALNEKGLRDFLVLLSIYQTLRYRGLNFWEFLRSGETDIDKFTGRGRRSTGPSPRPAGEPALRPSDPHLAKLVRAWPSLPDAIRKGIRAMVRAASG
jgi:predicted RecB family nuclease